MDEFFKRGLKQGKNCMENNPSNNRFWKYKHTVHSAQNENFQERKKYNHVIKDSINKLFTKAKLKLHWHSLMLQCLLMKT